MVPTMLKTYKCELFFNWTIRRINILKEKKNPKTKWHSKFKLKPMKVLLKYFPETNIVLDKHIQEKKGLVDQH